MIVEPTNEYERLAAMIMQRIMADGLLRVYNVNAKKGTADVSFVSGALEQLSAVIEEWEWE